VTKFAPLKVLKLMDLSGGAHPSRSDVRTQLLYRHVQWFRGGLVFKDRRLLYHSTLGLRVTKKKKIRI